MSRWLDWAVRGYLVFAAVQAFGIGLTGLIVPLEMQIPLRLTPLNYRFVAALYVSGGVGIALALFAPRLIERRLVTFAFGLATLLVLLLTILHWQDFMGDDLPHRPLWIFVYVADPLLALILVPLAGLWPPRPGGRHALSPLLWVDGVVFGALGLVLLLAPETAAAYWPWVLPPLVGQLYACFVLTFAVGALLAARETEPRVIRDYLIALLSLCLLALLVSVVDFDRFGQGPSTLAWFALFGIAALGCVWGLIVTVRQPARTAAVVHV
jgi:hypothetical protein